MDKICENCWNEDCKRQSDEFRKYKLNDCNGWIPCTKVDHPDHDNDCEVTIRDATGIRREIGFYTDRWRRTSDEMALDVIAWKEPSQPFNPIVR